MERNPPSTRTKSNVPYLTLWIIWFDYCRIWTNESPPHQYLRIERNSLRVIACPMVSEINLLYHREIVPLSGYYLETNIYASTIFSSTSSTSAGLSKLSNLDAQIIGIRLRLCCLMTQATSCFYKHQIMVDYIWLIQIMKKIIFWKTSFEYVNVT